MRKSAALSFAAIGLAAIVAAGCSGSGNTATPGGTPSPGITPSGPCQLPTGYSAQQVFPQANAPAAPNLQGVVFAVKPGPLPTNWYFYVTSGPGPTSQPNSTLGTAQIGFLATPSPNPTASPGASPLPTGTPLPTPSDVPSPGSVLEIASIGIFANATTFVTYLANTTCSQGIRYNTFTTDVNNNPSPSPAPTATST
jgi:hypothetical protein